jgi:hypothetical protein
MCLHKTYVKVRNGKFLIIYTQNIQPLILKYAAEYALRKFQTNQKGMELNRT